MEEDKIVYIVETPAWDSEFDSVWSTVELARARADELDPIPDKDGVLWGIISARKIDDPDFLQAVERRPGEDGN